MDQQVECIGRVALGKQPPPALEFDPLAGDRDFANVFGGDQADEGH